MRKKSNRNKSIRQRRADIAGYAFLLPFIIGFFVLKLYPLLSSLYYSMTDYSIVKAPNWVGLKNYIRMFTEDELFWQSLKVTFNYAIVKVPLTLLVSLIIALALSKNRKLTNFYRVVFYLPTLIGGVAVMLVWRELWGPTGIINQLLQSIGLKGHNWLYDPDTALYVLILYGVWAFGSGMFIFVAAIKDVPEQLKEAARIDGASNLAITLKVTIPMISPSIFLNLVRGIISSMQVFGSALLITNGGPMNSTLYYSLHQYRQSFVYMKMGYGSALAWVMALIILGLTALVFKRMGAWVYYQEEM